MSDDHSSSRAPILPAVCADAGVLAIVGSVLVPILVSVEGDEP